MHNPTTIPGLKMTFICLFSHGVSCKLSVPDEPPPYGSMPETDDYIWTGKPTEQQFTDYMIWRFYEVQRKICDLWDISHTTILKFTTHRQMFEYEPGQLPKMTVLDSTGPEQMPPLLTPSCDPMKPLASASCGLALTVPAFARIGETLEQAKQRCGEIQREEEFKGHRRIDFERNGFHVMTIF